MSEFFTIDKTNRDQYTDLLEKVFKLRTRVFHHKLRWKVEINKEGQELDKYDDDPEVIYLVGAGTDEDGQTHPVCFLRVLPTLRPTLLYDTFENMVPLYVRDALKADDVWDCTRFCIDDTRTQHARRTSSVLLTALGELAVARNIRLITGVFTAGMIKIYEMSGCKMTRLYSTDQYGEKVYFGTFGVCQEIVTAMKQKLGINKRLLTH